MSRPYSVAWREAGQERIERFTTATGAHRFAMFQLQRGQWPTVRLP